MKIGKIGKGTVGSAVFEGLEYLGHTMTFFDPKHEGSTMSDDDRHGIPRRALRDEARPHNGLLVPDEGRGFYHPQ
jgi:hypothetical protein